MKVITLRIIEPGLEDKVKELEDPGRGRTMGAFIKQTRVKLEEKDLVTLVANREKRTCVLLATKAEDGAEGRTVLRQAAEEQGLVVDDE